MSPEDKETFAKAYRAWMDANPDAEKPIDPDVTFNGAPLTPRVLMELSLASGELFDSIERLLSFHREITIDGLIEMSFGPQPKTESAPPPPARKTAAPKRHWKL